MMLPAGYCSHGAAGTSPIRSPFVTLRRFLLFLVTLNETLCSARVLYSLYPRLQTIRSYFVTTEKPVQRGCAYPILCTQCQGVISLMVVFSRECGQLLSASTAVYSTTRGLIDYYPMLLELLRFLIISLFVLWEPEYTNYVMRGYYFETCIGSL